VSTRTARSTTSCRSALHDGIEVGYLWLGLRGQSEPVEAPVDAYVHDVAVLPHLRGRGYGTDLMRAAEDLARGLGAGVVRLNVFGHNAPARRLYDRLGYTALATRMTKPCLSTMSEPPGPTLRLEPLDRDRWAAYDEGLEVGRIRLRFHLLTTGEHAAIDDLVVDEPGRGRGYGPAVVAAAERVCRGRDVVALAVDLDADLEAHDDVRAWCEQSGFEVTATTMSRLIQPAGARRRP